MLNDTYMHYGYLLCVGKFIVIKLIMTYLFKVFTNFEAVYQNYTNMNELNICINYTIHTFPNLQIINKLLDGVKCDDYNSTNTISKHLYISYTLKFCLNGTEVHNVKTSGPGKNEQYCGKHFFPFSSLFLSLSLTHPASLQVTSTFSVIYNKITFFNKIILMILFRSDLRKISTSDTTSKMATEATISRTLETTIFSAKSWVTEEKDDSKTSESIDILFLTNTILSRIK